MRVALCQIEVGDSPTANLDRVASVLQDCGDTDIAIFPEGTHARIGNDLAAVAEPLDGEFVSGLCQAARQYSTAVIAGVWEPAENGKVYNTAVAIDADGRLAGMYRKIHMFDAFSFTESAGVAAGEKPVVVELAGMRIGLTICYDLRFPELYRALVDEGAQLFAIIAAWTPGTFKEEHWTTLVRARAIENTMWTVAVGKSGDQTDPPSGGRTGVGRSLSVDPMGAVRADLGPFANVQSCDIDPELTKTVRTIVPSLSHRKLGTASNTATTAT